MIIIRLNQGSILVLLQGNNKNTDSCQGYKNSSIKRSSGKAVCIAIKPVKIMALMQAADRQYLLKIFQSKLN